MSAFGQSLENSRTYDRERRRRRAGCPLCHALPEEADSPQALGCDGPFHRGEPGRLPSADLKGVAPLPEGLCRCVVCCCPPGEGHRSQVWQVYERAMRALDEAAEAPGAPLDISPEFLGDGAEIREWLGVPGRMNVTWTGTGWTLMYKPQEQQQAVVLSWGDRLARVRSGDRFDLVPVSACVGDLHVTPHRGCILR